MKKSRLPSKVSASELSLKVSESSRKNAVFGCIAIAMVYFSGQAAAITTVDYFNIGALQTGSLDMGGITVTGSANINVQQDWGLGIVGGALDIFVDTNEYIQFDFNAGEATDVSYFAVAAGNSNGNQYSGERILEVFDTSGVSLGTVLQSFNSTFSVTSLFGDVAISRFTLTSPGFDSFSIGSISYSAIPVPPAVWLFGSGLLGLVGVAQKKAA